MHEAAQPLRRSVYGLVAGHVMTFDMTYKTKNPLKSKSIITHKHFMGTRQQHRGERAAIILYIWESYEALCHLVIARCGGGTDAVADRDAQKVVLVVKQGLSPTMSKDDGDNPPLFSQYPFKLRL